MYDIVIIGAGAAGLTSAIYAERALKKTLVLESSSYGGQIVNASKIENYPAAPDVSGFEFSNTLYNQAKDLGALVVFEKVMEIKSYDDYKEIITDKNKYKSKTVIIATGSKNRKLNISNEDELVGKGISYCATCDGAFYRDKTVAIVGGGNTALSDALYLSDIAKKVYLIHRRDEFRGEAAILDEIKNRNNIEIICRSSVVKLNGIDKLESIELSSKEKIEVDGLFVAIGRVPETKFIENLISLDEYGYIIASEDCHTKVPGIFVAGDNRKKEVRQLVTATSDGAVAAMEAINYINGR